MADVAPTTRPQWNKALDELPTTPEKIPAFFFAHGRAFPILLGTCYQRTYSLQFTQSQC